MSTPLDRYVFGAEQRCFGCGPHNEHGLRLEFERDGDWVVTRYRPGDGQDGPPGILHGGLQATLLDEVAAWTVIGQLGRMGFTFSMQVRLLRPVRTSEAVIARGRILDRRDTSVTVRAELVQGEKVCASGKLIISIPDVAGAEKVLSRALPPSWRRFCRDGDTQISVERGGADEAGG